MDPEAELVSSASGGMGQVSPPRSAQARSRSSGQARKKMAPQPTVPQAAPQMQAGPGVVAGIAIPQQPQQAGAGAGPGVPQQAPQAQPGAGIADPAHQSQGSSWVISGFFALIATSLFCFWLLRAETGFAELGAVVCAVIFVGLAFWYRPAPTQVGAGALLLLPALRSSTRGRQCQYSSSSLS